MDLPTASMQGPSVAALNEVLADLLALPESEQRTKAIIKVQRQLDDLREKTAA